VRRGKLLITGMDIATSCGVADGCPGDNKPRAFTWDLRAHGKARTDKLAALMRYCERYFSENRVDALFYERGLPLAVAMKIGMSDDTMALLRGAIGIVEACASRAGVPRIEGIGVQEARRRLLGPGRIPAGEGKDLVRDRCRVLGWKVSNDDEADAACIWSMGVGIMSPMNSYKSMPLFGAR
jgi:hypothetical protein